MSMNLTQPEEVDQILESMAWEDMKLRIPSGDQHASTKTWQQGSRDAYVSPYRAAYMKSHGFSDQ